MKSIGSILFIVFFIVRISAQQFNDQGCLIEARTSMPPMISNAYCTPYVVNPAETFSIGIQLNQDGYKSIQLNAVNWSLFIRPYCKNKLKLFF